MAITDLFVNNPDDRAVVYPSWGVRLSSELGSFYNPYLYGEDPNAQQIYMPPRLKSQLSSTLKPRKVSWSAGGSSLDYAQVDFISTEKLENRLSQPGAFVRICDILLPSRRYLGDDDADLVDPDTGRVSEESKAFRYGGNVRLLVGDYVSENESVSNTEYLTAQIAVVDTMFGRRLPGFQYWTYFAADPDVPGEQNAYYIDEVQCAEIVFNPMVDGVVRGNKASNFASMDHVWIDWSIGDSQAAQVYVGQTVSEWTIPEALKRVCLVCNEPELYVRNPVINEEDILWEGALALKNVVLATGYHLPYYLDALLHPNGYNWCVDPQTQETDVIGDDHSYEKPIIRIFRKGWSPDPPKELNFQASSSVLDLSKSNVNEYQIDRTITDAYNGVRVLGGPIKVELTLALYPGWQESEDNFTADELSKSTGSQYAGHRTAHRLWIANEWAGFDDSDTTNRVTEVPKFGLYFGYDMPDNAGIQQTVHGSPSTIIRKRVLEPPLTYQGTGEDRIRRDVLLQFRDFQDGIWVEVSSEIGGWAVLGDQIGIFFDDDKPPEVLMELWRKRNLRMRVTGTISSDMNLFNKFTEFPANLNLSATGKLRSLTINKEEEFRLWYVLGRNAPDPSLNTLPAASVLAADPAGAETHDDRQALVDFGQATLRNVKHAEYSANFNLPGWHTEYKIGDLISKINGREIGLNQSADPDDPRYMQITGIEWEHSDEAGPSTRIIVDRGINTVRRNAVFKDWQTPVQSMSEMVQFQVQEMSRKETDRMTNSLSTSSVAMDRLRGVQR